MSEQVFQCGIAGMSRNLIGAGKDRRATEGRAHGVKNKCITDDAGLFEFPNNGAHRVSGIHRDHHRLSGPGEGAHAIPHPAGRQHEHDSQRDHELANH